MTRSASLPPTLRGVRQRGWGSLGHSKAVRAGSRDRTCWVGGRETDRQTDTGTGTGVERAAVVVLPLGTAAEDVGMWDVLI